METVAQQIIDQIQRNRISSTEVADCLDKTGALPRIRALNRGHHRVGLVHWSYAYNESNWELHEQVRDVAKGSIVVTDAFNCGDRALYGNLVAKFLVLYRQAGRLVACGLLRDIPHLIKENWPVWLEGTTPVGCFNRKNDKPLDPAVLKERQAYFDGAIAVCDDTGVVVITREFINADFLKKLDWIEEQEDLWFDCIDRKKWDTFDTVCLKRYEKESK